MATVVGLGFRALHCTFIMVRVRVRGCNILHSACASYIEAVTSRMEDTTADIEAATALLEAVMSHIEDATAHIAPAHHT